jgi:hypothetical protein
MRIGLTDQSQRDPSNSSEKHRDTPRFCACAHAMQPACPQGCAYAAMRGCSPRLNSKLQRETVGSSPFLRARSRYATCMSSGLRVRDDARMLAQAKPRIGRGWDLVSQIGCIKAHRMAAKKLGALSISVRALALHRICSECRASTAMRGCSPRPKHASGENGT